jgi:hypothetical protein
MVSKGRLLLRAARLRMTKEIEMTASKKQREEYGLAISIGFTRALENAGLKSDHSEREARIASQRRVAEEMLDKHAEILRALADR